jgi:hypothetical protein
MFGDFPFSSNSVAFILLNHTNAKHIQIPDHLSANFNCINLNVQYLEAKSIVSERATGKRAEKRNFLLAFLLAHSIIVAVV